jgi:hypothetical protein
MLSVLERPRSWLRKKGEPWPRHEQPQAAEGLTLLLPETEQMIDALMHYIERAVAFERLAADESDTDLKACLEGQATAYRNLAAMRAQEMGLPPPSPPSRLVSAVAER